MSSPARALHHDVVSRVIKSATGAVRKTQLRWEWDVSGDCESPVSVELYGRPSADHTRRLRDIVVKRRTKHSLMLDLQVPCRKCRKCRKRRSRMWAARACHEIREANRTWFGTFTLRPAAHYVMQARALKRKSDRAIPIKELAPDDVIAAQSEEVAIEMTKYFKRVRKECGSRSLRYLLVREDHKTGLPHYHALIHESGDVPIRHAVLEKNWTLGFTKFKLLESEQAAFYVAKYLTKSHGGRVRASLGYGRLASAPQTASAIASEAMRDEPKAKRLDEDVTRTRNGKNRGEEKSPISSVLVSPKDAVDLCKQESN